VEKGGNGKVPGYPSAVVWLFLNKNDNNTLEVAVILDDEA